MQMRKPAGVAYLLGLLCATAVQAKVIAPPPLAMRVATADSVVIGKVISLEDKPVSAPAYPGDKGKADFTVAVVKVESAFGAARDLTHVRVGFIPTNNTPRRRPGANLTKDEEVILFLTPHHEASFQTMPAYFDVVHKTDNSNYEMDLTEVKRCLKLLANPKAGLESKDRDDRFLTAAMLIHRYRTAKPSAGEPKQEPIDAAESKLILQTLAEGDWNNPKPGGNWQVQPQNLFYRLGLTDKDGWKQPEQIAQIPEAARQWLKENATTYRIQRYVAEGKK
jgi:hypothetical protein